jgi:heat shock protein HtpX
MNLWKQADSNKNRSILLIAIFIVIVIAIGYIFSIYYNSPLILIVAVIIAVVQALLSYFAGDSIVLATSGAQQIQKKDNPELWRIVENLAITAGLPMPKVYIISDNAPNAFATGRDPKHASIAVTSGLLDRLDKSELEGVVAHELSHVGNYDIRIMTIVVVLVGVIAIISDIFIRSQIFGFGRRDDRDNNSGGIIMIIAIAAAILAPIVATIVQLAISRKREFLADADGALLTRYPEGLASALEKISAYKQPVEHASTATSHLYISNPLGSAEKGEEKTSFFANLFSTHPSIKERVRILRGKSL